MYIFKKTKKSVIGLYFIMDAGSVCGAADVSKSYGKILNGTSWTHDSI